jgi:hypothetical protein
MVLRKTDIEMKTFEDFLNENIYSARDIELYIKDISDTPETDIPDYYIDIIKKNNVKFELKTVKIKDLLAKDKSLEEYVLSGEDRYENSDYEPSYDELNNPIVIYRGEVIDGYNRTGQLYRAGESDIDAYVSID